jgi:hypothetical protein
MSDFNPEKSQCGICESVIVSSYPGEFVRCKCGASFVDQTYHYGRYGGSVQSLSGKILNDLKSITGLGYEQDDIVSEIIDLMKMNGIGNSESQQALALTQLDLKIAGLGGSTPRELLQAGGGHKVIEYIEALKEGY